MEARWLLATIPVTSTGDFGQGTLRQAILDANANPASDTITFDLSVTDFGYTPPSGNAQGFWTIAPSLPLPEITAPVVIDGYTQAGARPNTVTTLDASDTLLTVALVGSRARSSSDGSNDAPVDGLVIKADGCTVRGLAIGGFSGSGVVVLSNGNTIAGNFLGTDVFGGAALANAVNGVLVDGGSGPNSSGVADNAIGGPSPADRNLISGNSQEGLVLRSGASATLVQNNFVGVARDGFRVVGNGGDGIVLSDAPSNTIRGNLIGGNRSSGIFVVSSGSTGNVIQGNLIGTDNFQDRLANLRDGIEITGASGNTIGGAGPGQGNVVSYNFGNGIALRGLGATGNTLQGNIVGLSVDGEQNSPNLLQGILVQNASSNTIGGINTLNSDGTIQTRVGNVIAANNGAGILMQLDPNASGLEGGGFPDNNLIQGNLVGTGINGTELGVGNGQEGIVILSGQNNVIGGTTPGAGNVISGNTTTGVLIVGPTISSVADGLTRAASNNRIQGNFIGTDITGRKQVRNLQQGVYIVTGVSNIVGGTTPGARNIISGNKGPGVQINGKFTTSDGQTFVATANQVVGNFIGPDITGTALLIDPDDPTNRFGNFGDGVLIDSGASGNFIGGTDPGARNLISGNGQSGVNLARGASDNDVQNNLIGTDVSGLNPLGNAQDAVRVDNAAGNRIGGTAANAGNVLSAGSIGVQLTGAGTTNNVIAGNFIGTDVNGARPLTNTAYGVLVLNGAQSNTIGGSQAGARNVISANGTGVAILGTQSRGIVLQGNYIGTDASGTRPLGNRQTGIVVSNSSGNRIGGDAPGAGNLISGNATSGVFIVGGSTGNLVQGNRIGTDAGGTARIANAGEGVLITNAPGNLIGGGNPGAGNLISGNGLAGVQIQGPASVGNRIEGNLIGTDEKGAQPLANRRDGVFLNNAGRNVVGGVSVGQRNVISGNAGAGVNLTGTGASATGNVVSGNFLGLDASGALRLGNAGSGVLVAAPDTVVGGLVAGSGNVISGNGADGVLVSGLDAVGAVVAGNRIGTNAAGLNALGNRGNGVLVNTTSGILIGGSTAAAGNLISGNVLSGASLFASSTVTLLNNRIGTDAPGLNALGNGVGVRIDSASNNTVGTPGAGNLIAASVGDGILITGPTASGNTVQANRIGTDAPGANALSNMVGVHIVGAPGNRIGGSNSSAGNLISANTQAGVYIDTTASSGNVVSGNVIGLDAAGESIVPRAGCPTSQPTGVLLTNTAGNIVGPGNVISGNDVGVVIAGFVRAADLPPGQALTGNVVQGNAIGTNVPRARGLGNSVGIYINGSARHQVIDNLIAGASSTGVTILGELSTANIIRNNRIGGEDTGRRALSNSTGIYIQDAPANTLRENTLAGNTAAGIYIFGSKASANLIRSNTIRPAGSIRQQYGVLLFNARNNPVPLTGSDRNQITGSLIANVREFTGRVPRTPTTPTTTRPSASRAVPGGPRSR